MKLFWFDVCAFVLILVFSQTSGDEARRPVARPGSAAAGSRQLGTTPEEKRLAAKAIVENYWSGKPRDRYVLLAKTYKIGLRRFGITNAAKYEAATQSRDRILRTRTYQRVEVSRDVKQKRDVGQVALLIDWEEKGRRGVMTYVFDLVIEAGQWKISNIAH